MPLQIQGCTVIDDSKNACLTSIVFPDASSMSSAPANAPCIVLQGTTTGLCCYTIPSGYSKIRFYAVGAGGNGTCGNICCSACGIGCSGGGGSMAYGCISVTSGSVICACFASGCTRIYYGGVQMAAAPGATGCTGGTGACICTPCVTCGGTAAGGNGCTCAGGASAGSPLGTGKSGGVGCYGGAGIGGCGSRYHGGGAGSDAVNLFCRFVGLACNSGAPCSYALYTICSISGGSGPNGNGRYQYDYGDGSCCYYTDPLLSIATSPGVGILHGYFNPNVSQCDCTMLAVYPSINDSYCCGVNYLGLASGPGAGGIGLCMLNSICSSCQNWRGLNGGMFAGGGGAIAGYSPACYGSAFLGYLFGGNGGLFGGGGAVVISYQLPCSCGYCMCMIGGCGGCGGGGGSLTYAQCGTCSSPCWSCIVTGTGGGPAVVYYLK